MQREAQQDGSSYILISANKPRAGKTTLKDYLLSVFPSLKGTSFAAPIRRIIYTLHNLDMAKLGDREYEAAYPYIKRALQMVGEGAKLLDERVWTKQTLLETQGGLWIIDDLRFPHELEEISAFPYLHIHLHNEEPLIVDRDMGAPSESYGKELGEKAHLILETGQFDWISQYSTTILKEVSKRILFYENKEGHPS